jgi:hypothetical protein
VLYFFAGFGHQAVIMFFVPRGFSHFLYRHPERFASKMVLSRLCGQSRDSALRRARPGLLLGFFWDRPLAGLAVLTAIFVGREMLIGFLIWLAGCGRVFLQSEAAFETWRIRHALLFFPSSPA